MNAVNNNHENASKSVIASIGYRAAVAQAHLDAARRDNASTQFLMASYSTNGQDVLRSVTAAIGTMGGAHAPIVATYQLLQGDTEDIARKMLAMQIRVPGYGNSFVKDSPDPIWKEAHEKLEETAPDLFEKVLAGRAALNAVGKDLHPNAAIYTAALALIMQVPMRLSPMLVVELRASAWREILTEAYYKQ